MPDLPEGESVDSLRTYANENLDEIKKNPKKHKLHKEFMDKTSALRRRDILTAPKLVKDVLKEYPSLTNFTLVSIWLICFCLQGLNFMSMFG